MSRITVYERFGKRVFDLALTVLLLIVISPLMLLVGLCSLWFLGYPVFFQQKRLGLRGKPFILYKFRSMAEKRDASGGLLPDSVRLTMYGRILRSTSLDEFPSFWNVLKGEMSLVGPRPLLPAYLPRYTARQGRRHDVKPGITGWAQINGRNSLTWEEKFELDVWYVDHRSLWLDVKILWLTLLKVLKRDGISQDGHATMSEFLGSEGLEPPTR